MHLVNNIIVLPFITIWRIYNYELWWKRHKTKEKLLNSSATKFRTKFNIFFIKLLLVGAIAVVISGSCLIFGAAQGIIESAPDISSINVSPEGYATKIYDNNGEEIQTLATTGANRIYASLDQIQYIFSTHLLLLKMKDSTSITELTFRVL